MKILAVGPSNFPVTGQSKCFNFYVDNSENSVIKVYSTGISKLYPIIYTLKLIYHSIFSSYDAVYFTSSRTKMGFIRDLILVFLNYKRKCKIINHLHGADFKSFYLGSSQVYRWLIEFVYNRVDASIVLSHGMKSEYSNFDDMVIHVVNNFYDQCEIGNVNNFLYKPKINVTFLSNLIETKGYKQVIEAVLKANAVEPDAFSLSIAGSSLGNKDVIDYCKTIDDSNITFCGVVSGQKKSELLNNSDILVLPSYYPTEAQPLCLIEGMASGCYIITTNHNYISEIVSDENGKLIEIDSDARCFKKALVEDILNELIWVSSNRKNVYSKMKFNVRYAGDYFSPSAYLSKIDHIVSGN